MKALLALVVFTSCAFCADLSGNWVARQPTGDGNFRETYLDLKQDGNKLSGRVISNYRVTPITEGTVNGDSFTLVTTVRRDGQDHPARYEGKIAGNKLRVTLPARGVNNPSVELEATKAAPGAGNPPARIEPPALHPVKDNGLARTPPMGWNSWNKFAGRVTDADVRGMADAIVSSGMKKAGYVYVNIDDTWEGPRDASGNITTNRKFPDMKALADYVHGKGLKIGIYSSPGPTTCAGYPGSYGHEQQDAKAYAAWGFDYLKYDWCSAAAIYQDSDMPAVYQKMGDALLATGRPIVYSLCQYGRQRVQDWGHNAGGNLWRTTGDIRDAWESMAHIGFDLQAGLETAAGPGYWNDPDMLEVGNGGMSEAEYRTHMSLWSMLAAPLLAGNDLRMMGPSIGDLLMNPEVIAIDQDKLGQQGKRVSQSGDQEIWTRPLADGSVAVALFNRAAVQATIKANWASLGVKGSPKIRNVWTRKDVASTGPDYEVAVVGHGVVMLKVK